MPSSWRPPIPGPSSCRCPAGATTWRTIRSCSACSSSSSSGSIERVALARTVFLRSSRRHRRLAPGPALAPPRHLAIDPQVDVYALEAPFAGALLGERVPGAHAEHAVLERPHVVLQDRPEALDAHAVVALGAHQHLAHAVLPAEVVVGLVVPQRLRRPLEALAPD